MRTGVLLRWTAHPLTVGATVVLLLNDHVLKQAWPGLVTGKLSDVAGLVVAPPVLGLLFGLFLADRIGAVAAVLTTGAGFALVKLTAGGAGVASAAWSVVNGPSVVLADPADLVALPALGLAWWAWRRVAGAPPLPDGLASRVRVVVAVPLVVLAITATSAPDHTLPSVDSVRSAGSQVVIEVRGQLYRSSSGVDGWTLLSTSREPPQAHRPQVEACLPEAAAHCYRVHGAGVFDSDDTRGGRLLGVDETIDGGRTWHTAWEVPAARWEFVKRQHPFPADVTRVSEVASVEVLVRAVPGGHEVFVANGVDGLAVRDAAGAWRRVAFVSPGSGPAIRPAPLTAFGQSIGDDVGTAGLLALLALVIGTTVAAARVRSRYGRGLAAAVPVAVFAFLAVPITGLVPFVVSTSGASTVPWLVTTLCLVGIGTVLALAQRPLRRSRMLVVVAAAVLTALASAAPALGWTVGHPQEHGTAVVLGLIFAAACVPVVVAVGWWAGARDPDVLVEPPWPRLPG
ncbi:hypothetical protein [Amycolatopsis sp. NPDC021455]|uniref:hypothetical protein n=1 Tax=Amycolatopsis sp. NPDC021455 TaxID=3154901 RepID=UPI00340B17DD